MSFPADSYLNGCYHGCPTAYVDCNTHWVQLTTSTQPWLVLLHVNILLSSVYQLVSKKSSFQHTVGLAMIVGFEVSHLIPEIAILFWLLQLIEFHPWSGPLINLDAFQHTFYASYIAMKMSTLAECIRASAQHRTVVQTRLVGLNYLSVCVGALDIIMTVIFLIIAPDSDAFWKLVAPFELCIIGINTVVLVMLLIIGRTHQVKFEVYSALLCEIVICHLISAEMAALEYLNNTLFPVIPMFIWHWSYNITGLPLWYFRKKITARKTHAVVERG